MPNTTRWMTQVAYFLLQVKSYPLLQLYAYRLDDQQDYNLLDEKQYHLHQDRGYSLHHATRTVFITRASSTHCVTEKPTSCVTGWGLLPASIGFYCPHQQTAYSLDYFRDYVLSQQIVYALLSQWYYTFQLFWDFQLVHPENYKVLGQEGFTFSAGFWVSEVYRWLQ